MQQPEKKQISWHEQQWQVGTVVGLRSPGKAVGFIEHGSSADGTILQSAVHVIVGAQEGPVLYVQSAIHGDEVNGVEVLRRLLMELDPNTLQGVLIVVPIANISGFTQHRRRNLFDNEVSGLLRSRPVSGCNKDNVWAISIRCVHLKLWNGSRHLTMAISLD